jgi:hypothetical protein
MISTPEESSLLHLLPPLPRRERKARLMETLLGGATILTICGVCVSVAHGIVASVSTSYPSSAYQAVLGVIYVEIGLALFFWAVILNSDPGIIRRKPANSLPLPTEVREYLDDMQAGVEGTRPMPVVNIQDPEQRSYCVRCCVWRHAPHSKGQSCQLPCGLRLRAFESDQAEMLEPHHCSVCGFCVADFDHHCGFLGRCITGRNMWAFRSLLAMGLLGPTTTLLVVPLSSGAVAFAVAGVWAATWALVGIMAASVAGCLAWCARGDPLSCLFKCLIERNTCLLGGLAL